MKSFFFFTLAAVLAPLSRAAPHLLTRDFSARFALFTEELKLDEATLDQVLEQSGQCIVPQTVHASGQHTLSLGSCSNAVALTFSGTEILTADGQCLATPVSGIDIFSFLVLAPKGSPNCAAWDFTNTAGGRNGTFEFGQTNTCLAPAFLADGTLCLVLQPCGGSNTNTNFIAL